MHKKKVQYRNSIHLIFFKAIYGNTLNSMKILIFFFIVFPKTPLMTIEGPLGLCTLLEGPLMSLTSFPSLIASNAVSMRLAIGLNATLYEYTKKDIYY